LLGEVDEAAGVAPFVVVPGDGFELGAAGDEREAGVKDGAVGGLDDVGGDERLLAVGEDAGEGAVVGAVAEGVVDGLGGGFVFEFDGEVDE
jgi:hypothetical protein